MNTEVTIKIQSSNSVDFQAKKEALESIAMLDTDTISKLGQLSKSKKAVESLNNKWVFIKRMVM